MNDISAKLTAKDFATDQEVRWCPGCGDYAILKAVQRALAELGVSPDNAVFVSGIGCAARFPYYMETYGFHTIHGRAPAIATGVKLAQPELDVWVVCGDGDGLSIGGNHMLHVLRRNVDLTILLFNNEIYGLTKGQYSPTSRQGTRSPSTPMGSLDTPVLPARFALGSGARFVARSNDILQKHLLEVLKRAYHHKGASFVEIMQNCIVYNDGVFADFTGKKVQADMQVHVAHGAPLVFGKQADKGLRLDTKRLALEVVDLGEGGGDAAAAGVLVHDETNPILAGLLADLNPPEFPIAMGVLYCNPAPTYADLVYAQIDQAKSDAAAKADSAAKRGGADMAALLRRGHTWMVEEGQGRAGPGKSGE